MDEKEKDNLNNDPKSKSKLNFQTYSKRMLEVYKNEIGLSKKYEHSRANASLLSRIRTKQDLKDRVNASLETPWQVGKISEILQSLDSNYLKLISYFSDMFHIRYVVTPVLLDKSTVITSQEYLSKYHEMMDVVDGVNLEVLVPDMLEEIFLLGATYPYAEKSNNSKTVMITLLPAEYCRTILKTNYGTNLIEFNYEYFNQFTNADELKEVLDLFPKEFKKGYETYKADRTKDWQSLNPRYSTSISRNMRSIPPFIGSLDGILEYEFVRENELQKSLNELNKIFTHRIPVEDGRPIFDLDEVVSIQRAISRVTANHEGLETITVFGETELLPLQEEGKIENKRINQAYNTIYNSAGLNANLFSGREQRSLELSQAIDKAMVWRMIQQINLFINLAVNNLYKFNPLQTEIKILPITIYDEADQIKLYRENANFGIGKLDAVVAAGVKQRHLTDLARLEQELDLNSLLKPLQSSHTASGAAGDEDNEGAEETNTESEDSENRGEE